MATAEPAPGPKQQYHHASLQAFEALEFPSFLCFSDPCKPRYGNACRPHPSCRSALPRQAAMMHARASYRKVVSCGNPRQIWYHASEIQFNLQLTGLIQTKVSTKN